MATIAQGVMGPMAGWLMLLFIMVTLYDAQFPFYDTFIGRTTCDAIAVTGRARRPYRFYYFVVVTAPSWPASTSSRWPSPSSSGSAWPSRLGLSLDRAWQIS